MKSSYRLLAIVCVLLGTVPLIAVARPRASAKHVAARSKVPRDFKVAAQYGPGESDWKWWTTTILANGNATQTARDQRTTVKKLSLSQVEQLVSALHGERFSELSKEYRTEGKDGPTLILTLSENGRSHQVTVFLPSRKPDDPQVRRFLKVWSLVLTLLPAPNPEQTPETYRSPASW